MATRMHRPSQFALVRNEAGAVAADPAVISTANYPITGDDIIDAGRGIDQIIFFWDAKGGQGAAPGDTVDLDVLIYNNEATDLNWVIAASFAGVGPRELVQAPVYQSCYAYIRVRNENVADGEDFQVWAAKVTGQIGY